MENNFNLRKFLTENKLTINSQQLQEEEQSTFFKATVNLNDKPDIDYGYTLYAQDEEGAKAELEKKTTRY